MDGFEKKLWGKGFSLIAGVDEAGRGALAGPVVAAAVILPPGTENFGLRDSKKLTPSRRESLFDEIKEKAVSIGIGVVEPEEIDRINILKATLKAMETAVSSLTPPPDYILIDGNQTIRGNSVKSNIRHRTCSENLPPHPFPLPGGEREYFDIKSIPQEAIVKGDDRSISIAAASIIAKVTRDRLMASLHEKFPQYNFPVHKGYGTEEHREAIDRHGLSPVHRKSFVLKKKIEEQMLIPILF